MALDPTTIHVTYHACGRYIERRGWPKSYAYTAEAEHKLRELLDRCAASNPPLHWSHGKPTRRYRVGDTTLVVDPDNTTLITVLMHRQDSQSKRRKRKAALR